MTAPAPAALRPASSPAARALGAATLGLTLAALALGRRSPPRRRAPSPASDPQPAAARRLYTSAALLAASVLSDSAMEHYRGGFENPGMAAPLASAALVLACATRAALAVPGRKDTPRADAAYGTACAVGAAGLGFHAYNVTRRPGGLSWGNLFYAAPLGAPAALSLAGLLGLAARRIAHGRRRIGGLPGGQAVGLLSAVGLAGTSAEAALLHFRGAYHNPAMWLPVALPPVGAALLAGAALAPPARPSRLARTVLDACTLLGMAGVAFHARGIARQMGGWNNWRQNVLAGPPLPAPPSFSALALAGGAALALRARDPA